MIEITRGTYLEMVKGFEEKTAPILHILGGSYYVSELEHNESLGEKDRFYARLTLVVEKR